MKIKSVPAEKKQREPRLDWHQPIYSDIALKMMEEATGQRFSQLPAVVKPAVPAAVPVEPA